MLKDMGSRWDRRLQSELEKDRALGLILTYWTDPLGVVFNWGSLAPGKLMAEVADEITRIHRESKSDRELIIDGVGFSSGCEALLRAARETREAKFRRMVFLNSSSFAFSGLPSSLVAEGRIQEIRNLWSPFDIVTLFAPLGAGQFGLQSKGENIHNQRILKLHSPFLINTALRNSIRSYVADERTRELAPREFGLSLTSYLESLTR